MWLLSLEEPLLYVERLGQKVHIGYLKKHRKRRRPYVDPQSTRDICQTHQFFYRPINLLRQILYHHIGRTPSSLPVGPSMGT